MFCIRQGQHNNRSPPDVGFFILFWNVKVFYNSGICLCTSKWDLCMYIHDSLNTTTVVVLQVLFHYVYI